MKDHFLGLDTVSDLYRIRYTATERQALTRIPFRADELKAKRETHVLVAGYKLSIVDMRRHARRLFYPSDWYVNQPFANQDVGCCWYLLRHGPVPGSLDKGYRKQERMVDTMEHVPFACEMVYMMVLYALARHERLLQEGYVRCRDQDTGGNRIRVGAFTSSGLGVTSDCDAVEYDFVGVASALTPH